ncbi:NAD(+) synthase [Bacteroides sp. 519]|uniref:NAD(+) synthase n=1 Tax=Bacteroides sp. 519 TaxID=2302937 RepID=UPI0013D19E89|nr:NAD(+) synthase [Bacteroides sp. 519]NDV57966.1 NAD(+) synthase [Bacteroides sp. 519]
MKELIIKYSSKELEQKIIEIISFIKKKVRQDKVVIAISGGLDSDVVARLTAKAIDKSRIKLFIVIQREMEEVHISNARELASDLGITLHEIFLEDLPYNLIHAIGEADPIEEFNSNGLLDPSRAKCSIRTSILSTYQDRGYIVIGTSNRTEYETGFFLPFGDGVAHLKPIVHLYKTQVRQIAEYIGTNEKVIKQPASAGFWEGQTDLEDLAYWIYNEGPIKKQRIFNTEDDQNVLKIKNKLKIEYIDIALLAISKKCKDEDVCKYSKLPLNIVMKLRKLTVEAKRFKHRKLNEQIRY